MTSPKANSKARRTRAHKPFRLAILADIHADYRALSDALARIHDLGCDQVVCAGDLVDYGFFPLETISLVREKKIQCISGNHDRWTVKGRHDATGWDLTAHAMAYLKSLPEEWHATLAGVRVCVWHARPGSDVEGIYPDLDRSGFYSMLYSADADVIVVGHTHLPMCLTAIGRRLIVNPGALLRDAAVPFVEGGMLRDPMTGNWSPAPKPGGGLFAVLELPERVFTVYRAADGVEVEIERWYHGLSGRRLLAGTPGLGNDALPHDRGLRGLLLR